MPATPAPVVPPEASLCVRGARVLAAPQATPGPACDVWIAGARLAGITPAGALPLPPGVETLDAAGCLAMPGLVSAHTHSYTSLLADTVPGAPLDLFVLEAMARRAPRSPRMVYISALVHGLQLLKRGVTGLVDHVRHGALPSVEAVEACLQAYRDLGLRATVAPMYEDRSYIDSLPIDARELPASVQARWAGLRKPPPEAYFELMDAVLHWRGHGGRLDVMLGVDGPQRCSPRLLSLTGRYADQHAMGLHTHLLESKTQSMMTPRGGSLVQVIDRHGLLNSRSSLAHFVWCTQRDMALVAERGAHVVHNPLSNLHLGSGLQPTRQMLDLGVNVALGTDSESGHDASLLEQARLMAVLSRVRGEPETRWIQSAQALHAATAAGARVLGLPAGSGTLQPGAPADITLVDTTGLDWLAARDPTHHLVMAEQGSNVRHVVVNGLVVLRDRVAACPAHGTARPIDEAALLAEAVELAAADDQANAPGLAIAASERAVFSSLIERALARRLRIERHARSR